MPDLKYSTPEEMKDFFKKYTSLYRALGYTDQEITDHIDKLVKDENTRKKLERYEAACKLHNTINYTRNRLGKDKYGKFWAKASWGSYLSRVVECMYKPETCAENITYNENLTMRLQSYAGVGEVLQEAATLLVTADPTLTSRAKKNYSLIEENYQTIILGFSVAAYLESIRSRPELKRMIPGEILTNLQENKLYYEQFQNITSQVALDANILHLVIPEDKTGTDIAKAVEVLSAEDQAKYQGDLSSLISQRIDAGIYNEKEDNPKEPVNPYKEIQQKKSKEYLNKVHQRMVDDDWGIDLPPKRKERLNDGLFLMYSGANALDITDPEVPEPVKQKNQKHLKESFSRVHKNAKENYEKPLNEAAEDIHKTVKMTQPEEDNEAFIKMQGLMGVIETICHKSTVGELTDGEQELLSEMINQLENAAATYLSNTYKSTEEFSGRTRKCIDAARMCSAFAHGRKYQLILEKNRFMKTRLATIPTQRWVRQVKEIGGYTRKNYVQLKQHARKAYTECPNIETYARYRALTAIEKYVKDGLHELSEEDFRQFVHTKIEAFKLICQEDPTFAAVLRMGNIELSMEFEKLLGKRIRQQQLKEKMDKERQNNMNKGMA